MNKKLIPLLCGLTLLSSLVGCSGVNTTTGGVTTSNSNGGSDKVTIRFAHTWAGADTKAGYFATKLAEFREENPNIEIIEETASGDELRTQTKVNLASNNLPDIITYWGGSILQPLVENDRVLDIGEYLKLSSSLKEEDIDDAAWQFYTFNGKKYGVPIESYMSALIVNKKMFEENGLEYPKTQEDFIKVGKVIKEQGIIPFAMGSKGGNPSHFYYSELYNQLENGTQEINEIGSTKQFNTKNALEVAKAIDEQRQAGLYPSDTIANGDWTAPTELYNSEKAAMVYSYPWTIENIAPELIEVSEIIPIPSLVGATKNPATFLQSSAVFGVVINKESFEDTKKQEAIVKFMDFLTSEDMYKELAKGGIIPSRNVDLDESNMSEMMKKLYAYGGNLEKVPAHYNKVLQDAAFTTFQESLDELFAGAITPEKFVEKVQESFDKTN